MHTILDLMKLNITCHWIWILMCLFFFCHLFFPPLSSFFASISKTPPSFLSSSCPFSSNFLKMHKVHHHLAYIWYCTLEHLKVLHKGAVSTANINLQWENDSQWQRDMSRPCRRTKNRSYLSTTTPFSALIMGSLGVLLCNAFLHFLHRNEGPSPSLHPGPGLGIVFSLFPVLLFWVSILSSSPNFGLGHNHTTAITGRSFQLLAEAGLCAGRTERELSFPALASTYQVQWTRISQKLVTQPTSADLNGYQTWLKDHFITNIKSFFQNILQQDY